MSLSQLACKEIYNEWARPVEPYTPLQSSCVKTALTREEKLEIVCSVLSGVGSKAHFDYETMRSRIQQCLSLAETML